MTLWISTILRNEVSTRPHCLTKMVGCVEELQGILPGVRWMVTDDASDDDTLDWVSPHADQIQTTDAPLFWQHEGVARQRHYDFTTQLAQPGDWVLALDADETVSHPERVEEVIDLAEQSGHKSVGLRLYEFWNETQHRTDGYWVGTVTPRLYRWQPHGQIRQVPMGCGSEPTYVAEAPMLQQNRLDLLHWGYMREEDRVRKHAMYTARAGGHGHLNAHVESIVGVPNLATYVY